jgi:hypothetical protein
VHLLFTFYWNQQRLCDLCIIAHHCTHISVPTHITLHHLGVPYTTVACQLAPDSSSSSDNSSIEKLSNAVVDAHLSGLDCIISDHPQLWTEPVPLTDGCVPGLSYISQASDSYCVHCIYVIHYMYVICYILHVLLVKLCYMFCMYVI